MKLNKLLFSTALLLVLGVPKGHSAADFQEQRARMMKIRSGAPELTLAAAVVSVPSAVRREARTALDASALRVAGTHGVVATLVEEPQQEVPVGTARQVGLDVSLRTNHAALEDVFRAEQQQLRALLDAKDGEILRMGAHIRSEAARFQNAYGQLQQQLRQTQRTLEEKAQALLVRDAERSRIIQRVREQELVVREAQQRLAAVAAESLGKDRILEEVRQQTQAIAVERDETLRRIALAEQQREEMAERVAQAEQRIVSLEGELYQREEDLQKAGEAKDVLLDQMRVLSGRAEAGERVTAKLGLLKSKYEQSLRFIEQQKEDIEALGRRKDDLESNVRRMEEAAEAASIELAELERLRESQKILQESIQRQEEGIQKLQQQLQEEQKVQSLREALDLATERERSLSQTPQKREEDLQAVIDEKEEKITALLVEQENLLKRKKLVSEGQLELQRRVRELEGELEIYQRDAAVSLLSTSQETLKGLSRSMSEPRGKAGQRKGKGNPGTSSQEDILQAVQEELGRVKDTQKRVQAENEKILREIELKRKECVELKAQLRAATENVEALEETRRQLEAEKNEKKRLVRDLATARTQNGDQLRELEANAQLFGDLRAEIATLQSKIKRLTTETAGMGLDHTVSDEPAATTFSSSPHKIDSAVEGGGIMHEVEQLRAELEEQARVLADERAASARKDSELRELRSQMSALAGANSFLEDAGRRDGSFRLAMRDTLGGDNALLDHLDQTLKQLMDESAANVEEISEFLRAHPVDERTIVVSNHGSVKELSPPTSSRESSPPVLPSVVPDRSELDRNAGFKPGHALIHSPQGLVSRPIAASTPNSRARRDSNFVHDIFG